MTYDPLHRIKTKTYSDATPDVYYTYHLAGSSLSPNIGQLESVSSTVATTVYGYTPLGQVDQSLNYVSGYTGDLIYNYDWHANGSLKSIEYPTGRLVQYDLDDAGRTSKVDDGSTTYADMTNITNPYTPDGRLAEVALGNGAYETREFYPPGTPTVYMLGTLADPDALLRISYEFDATNNNGNLLSQEITRGTSTWKQHYEYDGVNRLVHAFEDEDGVEPYDGFNREYDYDRYGNRWVSLSIGLSYVDTREPDAQSDFNAANNRLTIPGTSYDAAGNQTSFDGYSTINYDAEGRISSMDSVAEGDAVYSYDGDGRRVKKVWTPPSGPVQTTYYFYNALGQLAIEYSADVTISTETTYPFADMLGSVRAVTDQTGSVTESYDYLPFGRMLSASDNNRGGYHPPSPDNYVDSSLPQKFTGKERDETGLDYFGARYRINGERETGNGKPKSWTPTA